jgi:hypothetical protein
MATAASPETAKVAGRTCSNCGGTVMFQPGKNAVVCKYCEHTEVIEVPASFELRQYDLAAALDSIPHGPAGEIAKGGREVQCNTCGARAIVTGQATRCMFCDSPVVVELPDAPNQILPETVLPFGVDDKTAGAAFAHWMKSRWFAPHDLVKRSQAQALDGVYLPYWAYDSITITDYRGERGDDYYETEVYRDERGEEQTRTVTRTAWTYVSGRVEVDFADILVCGSKSVPDKIVDKLEPWDVPALRPFDDRYLAGFAAERYAVDLQHGFETAKQKMLPDIKRAIESDIGGDHQRIGDMSIAYHEPSWKHALFPLWLSAFRYRDKVYHVIVNARTGEVAGERPWSVFKIMLLILFIIAAIVGIVLLVHSQKSGHPTHR